MICIDPPRPSLGNQKEDGRSAIEIHFLPDIKGNSFLRVACKVYLATELREFRPLLGWTDIIQLPSTKLLDVTCVSAIAQYTDIVSEVLIISPRCALIRSTTDEETWAARISDSWTRDPMVIAEKVRHRPSTNIKAPYASIRATAAQISGAKARKGHCFQPVQKSDPKALQATFNIPLSSTGPYEIWLPQLMQQVSNVVALPLHRTMEENGTGFNEWRPIFNA